MAGAARVAVLDTSVFEHDPGALFRLREETLLVPPAVVESLDPESRVLDTERARNLRTAAAYLEELAAGAGHLDVEAGLSIPGPPGGSNRLVFPREDAPGPGATRKSRVLAAACAARRASPDALVTVISTDADLRLRARLAGLSARDCREEQVLEDASLLYSGVAELPPEAEVTDRGGDPEDEGLRVRGTRPHRLLPNQCLFRDLPGPVELIVCGPAPDAARVRAARNFRPGAESVWGIHARNREQNFALNLLCDEHVDLVTLTGAAGSGKTLLALAAGLAQTLEQGRYREILVTRATVPVGEDIGFLPGTEEEKMTPWMGALEDNLEVLEGTQREGVFGRAASRDLLNHRIKVRSLNFMRGRTFLDRYVILDEAQNLTPAQMRTLLTRIGPGSKVVCLGNIAQIDTPWLTETTSGLTCVVDRFKDWSHSAHITLRRGERSRLADYAAEVLVSGRLASPRAPISPGRG